MPAKMYYDADTDPSALAGQTVAVIGYGSQGHAHAQNLHESGVDVVVGLAPASKSRALVEAAGIKVADVADAVKAADVIMIAVPDTVQKAVYDTEIGPNLRPGQLLMFAHGFNIRFGRIVPPDFVDVGMVAPKGPGHLLRSVYVQGGGVPALFAVEQDPSGTARARASSARCTRRLTSAITAGWESFAWVSSSRRVSTSVRRTVRSFEQARPLTWEAQA